MKNIHRTVILSALLMGMLLPGLLGAQDNEPELSGFSRSRMAFQYDDGNLFLNEQMLSLKLDWQADTLDVHADVALTSQDVNSLRTDVNELYINWFGDSFDLRIGLQKILWGKADGVFISDQVSPVDMSAFLTKDIEELRLAVSGISWNYYLGAHQLEAVWLPVFTPSILPDADSIWAVAAPFPIQPEFKEAELPQASLWNAEYFLQYSWLGSLADFQLSGGWFWNDAPIATVVDKTFTPGVGITGITVQPEYYQVGLVAAASSFSLGPFILKGEASYTMNQRYQAALNSSPEGYLEKDTLQYLAGTDISFLGTTVSIQWIQDMILDYESGIQRDELLNTASCIIQRSFLRETIKAEIFSIATLNDADAMIKPQLSWIPGNGFQVNLGSWIFLGDSGKFGQYDDNDGIYLNVAYYF